MKNSTVKSILVIGLPLVVSHMAHYLMNVADTAMVGQLGEKQLASISMASLFFYVLAVLVWPISVGAQTITARRYGKLNESNNRKKENLYKYTGEVLDNGIIIAIVFGIIGILLVNTAPFILDKLIKDKTLLPLALGYLSTLKWVYPIIGITSAFTGFLSGIRSTKIIMVITIIPNIINVGLNYILIFGKLGISPMGIKGAALGTVIANLSALIMLVIFILTSDSIKKYKVFHFKKLDMSMIRKIINFSYPAAIQNGGAFAIFLFYQSRVEAIGTVYLAATHIIFTMFRINKTIVGGLARGASILAGNALGADKKDEANRIIISMEKIAAAIAIVILGTVMLFPEFIVSIFTKKEETELILISIKALRFFGLFFFAEVMGFSFEIIFHNIGWAKYVLFSEATTNILFLLLMTWLTTSVFHMGIYAAWLSFGLYQFFHAINLVMGYLSKRWENITIEKQSDLGD